MIFYADKTKTTMKKIKDFFGGRGEHLITGIIKKCGVGGR